MWEAFTETVWGLAAKCHDYIWLTPNLAETVKVLLLYGVITKEIKTYHAVLLPASSPVAHIILWQMKERQCDMKCHIHLHLDLCVLGISEVFSVMVGGWVAGREPRTGGNMTHLSWLLYVERKNKAPFS